MQGLQCGQWREVINDGVKTITCESWVLPGNGVDLRWVYDNGGNIVKVLAFIVAFVVVGLLIEAWWQNREKRRRERGRDER